MATVDEIKIVVKAEVDAAIAKMTKLDTVNKKNTQTGTDLAKSIAGYTNAYGLAVSAGQAVIQGIYKLGETAIVTAAAFERTKMEFGVMLGGMEAGNDIFQQMNSLASETPLALQDITSAGKQLLSVGVSANEVTEKIRMLGDIAMGDAGKLDRLTAAFAQLKSKGTASMEQINRFTEAGVPIIKALAGQFGVTEDKVFKLVSTGQVGFKNVEKALASLTGEGQIYHDMMKKVSETTEGKWSTTQDNFRMILAEMGTQTLPLVNKMLDDFNAKMGQVVSNSIETRNLTGQKVTMTELLALQTKYTETIKRGGDDGPFGKQGSLDAAQRMLVGVNKQLEDLEKKGEKAASTSKKTVATVQQVAEALADVNTNTDDFQKAFDAGYEKTIEYMNEKVKILEKEQNQIDESAMAYAELYRLERTGYLEQESALEALGTPSAEALEMVKARKLAQDEYNISANKGLEKQIDYAKELAETINKQLVSSFGNMAMALGEALVTGEDGWKAFGKAGLGAVAAVVKAFGDSWALQAAAALIPGLTFNPAAAIGYGALSAGAYAASGAINAIPMAEGGSGVVNKPTLFLAGEAGPESFSFGGRGSGRGNVTVIQNIAGSIRSERELQSLAISGMAKASRGY